MMERFGTKWNTSSFLAVAVCLGATECDKMRHISIFISLVFTNYHLRA
jgi:hypothetical protein